MGSGTFPKIRSTKVLNVRNQFGRKRRTSRYVCDACESLAEVRIDVARSWFPNEDEVFLLCGVHLEQARRGEWRDLFIAKKQRQTASDDRQIREKLKNESKGND